MCKWNLVATGNHQQLKAKLELAVVGFQWTHPMMEYGGMIRKRSSSWCIVLWYWCRWSFPRNEWWFQCAYVKVLLRFSVPGEFPNSSNTSVKWSFLWTVVYKGDLWFVYFVAQAETSWIPRAKSIRAMAVKISVERALSGEVCALEVQPDLTIRELKETMKKASCWISCSMLLNLLLF